jgi:hypothetical protein
VVAGEDDEESVGSGGLVAGDGVSAGVGEGEIGCCVSGIEVKGGEDFGHGGV